ncbi:hypothetical protein FRC00_007197 [Tulasnella sp. 408]|nr:hypothetical protein FRC00_007197 [Tulasnella sp. 408]
MSLQQGPLPQPLFASDEDSIGTPMGAPNESGASFVQSVQRIAFTQNRIKDDEWIAQYASTCFADSALEWYLTLEDETQTSWKKLRLALVQRYPVQLSKSAPASIVSGQPRATSSVSTGIGRIEVIKAEFREVFGYLSQDSAGKFVVDPAPENALTLQAVLHTDAQQQNKKIYSLRMLRVIYLFFDFAKERE